MASSQPAGARIDGVPPFSIVTPCDYRAEIYRRYLEEMVRTLKDIIIQGWLLSTPDVPFPEAARIKTALEDRELLESLARILDKWAVYGVIKDLEIWSLSVMCSQTHAKSVVELSLEDVTDSVTGFLDDFQNNP